MELKEFIANSLEQILDGVLEAAVNRRGKPGYVNPKHFKQDDEFERDLVEFDVAVTVAERGAGSGGAKISVVGLNLGGEGRREVELSSISRIKFTVGLGMPFTKIEDAGMK